MEKIIQTLQELLPGKYSWWPEVNSFNYKICWEGRYKSHGVERGAVYLLPATRLIRSENVVELAYEIRDELIKDMKDSDLILDLLMGKV